MLQSAKSLTFFLSKSLISLFVFLSPQPTEAYTHTESSFYQTISADAHPCRSEETNTAQMTQSQATQLPLFLCLEQKNSLTSTLPLDCHVSLDVIPMKPFERNSYYRKQQGIRRVLGLVPKRSCGRMHFAADCYEKSDSLKSS